MPAFSQEFEQSLHRAVAIAADHNHEYATLEHLLLSLIDSEGLKEKVAQNELKLDFLRPLLTDYIHDDLSTLVKDNLDDPKPTAAFQRVLQRAHIHVQSSGREEVGSLDALVAIFAERDTHAAHFLAEAGIGIKEVIAIRDGVSKSLNISVSEDQERRRLIKIIPLQSPAPVRVEEISGKISRYSERKSGLSAEEGDFLRWRQPSYDHIMELLGSDFRKGTNHDRIRSRLLSLSNLLNGSVEYIKEHQFALGYDIDRLGGILTVYNSSSDDVPSLNAMILEDLTRLHISLAMGIDKLESWSSFRQAVSGDLISSENAALTVVADALADFAAQMQQRPNYFDSELPATFVYLADAIRNPEQAEKTVFYGGVKSAENVFSFLAQKSLDAVKVVGDDVGKYITGAAAATLVSALASSASAISSVLPAGWTWLKPLLDLLAKIAGH